MDKHSPRQACRRIQMNLAQTIFLFAAGVLPAATDDKPSPRLPNVQGPTLGGTQFWSDIMVHHGWRIQRNAWTKHYRLLDAKNVRRAWGGYERCRATFTRLRTELGLSPVNGKVVVVLHGLGRTRRSMEGLCRFLQDSGDYTVINVTYASTRQPIGVHAANLARIIEGLKDAEEINFVAHSLGNLVIRHFLADQTDEARGARPDARIRRIVMLAPPNQGSYLAKLLKNNAMFQVFCGISGQQVSARSPEWIKLTEKLATPKCEFAIVAGGQSKVGNNPLLEGDNDLVVTVDETRLAGARDFIIVPVVHTFLMDDAKVHKYVLNFFRHGYFVAEEKRRSIREDKNRFTHSP